MSDIWAHRLGSVTLSPTDPVVAGSTGTWVISYTVGSYGIDEGGTIKLAHRFASDWESPQFDDPAAPAFATAVTDGSAKLRPRFDRKGHIRPHMKTIVIDVYDGSLDPGDKVTITLGDTSGGSPGARAQTFIESGHEFCVFVDPTNACLSRLVPDCPKVPVVSGKPVALKCFVPVQVESGEAFEVFVKGEDQWGNPTQPPADLTLSWQGSGDAKFDGSRLTLSKDASGNVIAASCDMQVISNAVHAYEKLPGVKRYWGDLHAQTDATVGTGTEVEYFTFGRDVAKLDFTSHQGNDFQMTDEDWQRLNDVVAQFHDDGKFVVFPGYEWSANTPAGGDRNVFFRKEGYPICRSSHWQIPEVAENENTPAHPASELFSKMRKLVPFEDVLLGSHVGGRYADIRKYFDEELGPLVEVVSCWGVFEWMLWDAFEKGYIVGTMCNSDGHKGRPGAEGPGAGEFGIAGGLTCVLAEAKTRDAIFDALKARRCYGTTGARIELDFTIDGHPMGSVINLDQPSPMRARVHGDAGIESLALYKGKQIFAIARYQPSMPFEHASQKCIRVTWRGARMRGRGRRVDWSGKLHVKDAKIESAATYCFDSAADGIDVIDEHTIDVRSQTTGDTDGIDLVLDQCWKGSIRFESAVGTAEVDLAKLTTDPAGKAFNFGGLDMEIVIQRYDEPADLTLELSHDILPATEGTEPYFVKAVQADGQMAWSSPIYVKAT